MVELRWFVRAVPELDREGKETGIARRERVLQWREARQIGNSGTFVWDEWRDVPVSEG